MLATTMLVATLVAANAQQQGFEDKCGDTDGIKECYACCLQSFSATQALNCQDWCDTPGRVIEEALDYKKPTRIRKIFDWLEDLFVW